MSLFNKRSNEPIITTTTQVQHETPWAEQAPHLIHAFKEARRLYEDQKPQYFPKPSVVPFAPETEEAMKLQAKRAKAGSALTAESQAFIADLLAGKLNDKNPVQAFLQESIKKEFLTQNPANEALKQTAEGQYLKQSERTDKLLNQAIDKLKTHFKEVIEPGIDATASALGRYGSGHHQQLKDKAYQTLAEQVGQLTVDFYAKHYAQERQNQISAAAKLGENFELARRAQFAAAAQMLQNYGFEREQQLNAAKMGPTVAKADYDDINRLAEIGGAREALAQTQLNDEVNRWNFTNNATVNKLAQYLAIISGGYGAESLSTTTQPLYRNQVRGGLLDPDQAAGSLLESLVGGKGPDKNLFLQLGSALLKNVGE